MKREINLASPEARRDRMERIAYRRERSIAMSIFIALAIVGASYGTVWWGFSSLSRALSDQLVLQSQDQSELEEGITRLNREIDILDAKISGYTPWTEKISEVIAALPPGIAVSKLELQDSPEALIITGSASEGSEVVAYQDALEALPWVDRVVAPLQNFARFPSATVTFTVFQKSEVVPPL